MLSYLRLMPNTRSTKKSLRSSEQKNKNNVFWKKKIKDVIKSIKSSMDKENPDSKLIKEEESLLQKTLDKAAKNKIIHKNKANRLKSKYAKRISALKFEPKS